MLERVFLIDKLDGLMRRKRGSSEEAHVDKAPSIDQWLTGHVPEDYVQRKPTQPGQKRVSQSFRLERKICEPSVCSQKLV